MCRMEYSFNVDCSVIISALTFLSTLYLGWQQNKINRLIGRKQLEIVFFNQTFMEHLTKKLPQVRAQLRFDPKTHYLTDADNLIDELNEIRRDAFYFCYLHEDFYKKLMVALQEFENFLVSNVEITYYDAEMQTECNATIKMYMKNIYDIIHDAYNT